MRRNDDLEAASEEVSLDASSAALYTEYLDILRFPDAEHQKAVTRYLRAKYALQHADIVLLVGYASLDFAIEHGTEIFGPAPFVFVGVEQSRLAGLPLPPNFTGLTHFDNVRGVLEAALALQPDTEEVVIPGGSSEFDQYWLRHDRATVQQFAGRLRVRYLMGLPMLSILRELGRLKPHTIVFVHAFYRDGSGQEFTENEMLNLVTRNSAAPVYGMASMNGRSGLLGGRSGDDVARYVITLRMALRILGGEKVSDIPVQRVPPSKIFAFDASQFGRWGIDFARIPAGSVVFNRRPSRLRQYRDVILGMAAFVALESSLIAILLVQSRRRRRAERLLAEGNRYLQESERSLRQLSGQLIVAQENERRRIARELHDDLNQQVADLGISLSHIKRGMPASMEEIRGEIASVQKRLMTLSDGLRQISHELHPGMLELFGLVVTLKSHCREFSEFASLPIEFETNCDEPVPMYASLCFYRVAQEAIRNAAKHSQASKVFVFLTRAGGEIRLEVSDNGVGFDREEAFRQRGLGLRSMEERARLIGGKFELVGHSGKGTTVIVTVTLNETTETPKPKAAVAAAG